MSGLCGWIDRRHDARDAANTLERMRGRLIGGDTAPNGSIVLTEATAVSTQRGIVSVDAHQRGALTVAAQGQIRWTASELAAISERQGVAVALSEAYRRHGAECLRFMGGPFAAAIIDEESRSGLLAIDRIGIRTLCYANPPGALVFGTTAESVATHRAASAILAGRLSSTTSIATWCPAPARFSRPSRNCGRASASRFASGWSRDASIGSCLIATTERFSRRPRTPLQVVAREGPRTRHRRGRERRSLSQRRHRQLHRPGLLTELRGTPARTYSIGFSADGFDEMKYARITARHFAANAHEYYLTPPDVVAAIPIIADAYDEPFGNESAVPTYFCAKMARRRRRRDPCRRRWRRDLRR